MESVDIGVSKSPAGNGVRVRVPPSVPIEPEKAETLAYVIGVALGDGNLSCPNGRATRLRISCDSKYPTLIEEIQSALKLLLRKNKVSLVQRKGMNCIDVSVYSNTLNAWMPWRVGHGSKILQGARVPLWIRRNDAFSRACLKGLIQTDGCIYMDRGYQMVNFTNNCKALAEDVRDMLVQIGFRPSFNALIIPTGIRYTTKVARDAERLIVELNLYKA